MKNFAFYQILILTIYLTQVDCKNCQCGHYHVRLVPTIVGGVESYDNGHPYYAAIGGTDSPANFSFYSVRCGGTIISDQWILTAGHCSTSSFSYSFAVIGSNQWDHIDISHMHLINMIVPHPQYSNPAEGFDLSLMRLADPLCFSERVSPVCLPASDLGYREALSIGLGYPSEEDHNLTPNLKEVLVINKDEECQRRYGSIFRLITETCGNMNNQSVCHGDSGGPLLLFLRRRAIQVGVVSWGRKCGSEDPAVYTRTFPYLSWIRDVTGNEGCYV